MTEQNNFSLVPSATYNNAVSMVIPTNYMIMKNHFKIDFDINKYIKKLKNLLNINIKKKRLHSTQIRAMCLEFKRVAFGLKQHNKKYRKILKCSNGEYDKILYSFFKIFEHMVHDNKLMFIKKHFDIKLYTSTIYSVRAYSFNIDDKLWSYIQQVYKTKYVEYKKILNEFFAKRNNNITFSIPSEYKKIWNKERNGTIEQEKYVFEKIQYFYNKELYLCAEKLVKTKTIKPLIDNKLYDVISTLFMETDLNKELKNKEIDDLYKNTIKTMVYQ